jgi:hypothetical protein
VQVEDDEDPNDVSNVGPGPADPVLTRNLVTAARADEPGEALEQVAVAGYAAGVTPVGMVRACYAAREVIDGEAPEGTEDPAEDAVLDLMDRLTGWCHPDARLRPLPPK